MTLLKNISLKTASFVLVILITLMMGGPAAAAEQESVSAAASYEITAEAEENVWFQNESGSLAVRVHISGLNTDDVRSIKLSYLSRGSASETISIVHEAESHGESGLETVFRLHNISVSADSGIYTVPVRIELLSENGHVLDSLTVRVQALIRIYGLTCGVISDNEDAANIMQEALKMAFKSDESMGTDYLQINSEKTEDVSVLNNDPDHFSILVIDNDPSAEEDCILNWILQGGCALISRESTFLKDKDQGKEEAFDFGSGRILFYDSGSFDETAMKEAVLSVYGDRIYLPGYQMFKRNLIDSGDLTLFDAFSPVLKTWPYRLTLIVFVIVSGPVMYLFLKRRDKLEFLWAGIPAAACIFAAMIYLIGTPMRASAPFIRYFRACNMTDEGTDVNTMFAVINPTSSSVVLNTGGLKNLRYGDYNYIGQGTNENDLTLLEHAMESAVIAEGDDRSEIMINPDGIFSRQFFRSSYFDTAKDSGKFEAEIRCDNGVISGEITNNTPYDLHGVFACGEGLYVPVGDLAAGETKVIETEDISLGLNYSAVEVLCRQLAENINAESAAAHTVLIRDFINSMMNINMYEYYICGFSADTDPAFDGGLKARGLTAFIHPVSMWQCGSGRKFEAGVAGRYADDQMADPEELQEEENTDIFYDYSDYPKDYIYYFAADYQPDCVRWLNPEVGAVCEWYNHRTGEYDTVFGNDRATAVISGDVLKDYIDRDHVLRIRYQGGTDYMIPVYAGFGRILQ